MSTAASPPSLWSYLRQGRWLALIAFMIAFSIVCIFLGRWQFDRYHHKKAQVAQVEAVWDASPRALSEVTEHAGVDLTAGYQWQRVTMRGYWVADSQLVLRNRPVDGAQAGHLMRLFYVPPAQLETVGAATPADSGGDSGSVSAGLLIPVEQGWAPADSPQVSPDTGGMVVAPQASAGGELAGTAPAFAGQSDSFTARIHRGEDYYSRDPAPGYVYTRNTSQIVEALDFRLAYSPALAQLSEVPVANYYLLQTPPPPDSGLAEIPRPSSSLGNHLSYAFQWWFFALAAQAVAPILARREREDDMITARLAGAEEEMAGEEVTAAASGAKKSTKAAHKVEENACAGGASGGTESISRRYAGAFIARRRADGEDEAAEDREIDSLL